MSGSCEPGGDPMAGAAAATAYADRVTIPPHTARRAARAGGVRVGGIAPRARCDLRASRALRVASNHLARA